MTTILEQYEHDGWVGPLPILTQEETAHYSALMTEADAKFDLMNSDYRCKSNVLFPWVDEISRKPILVNYVRQLIGDNFHCWDTLFWIKHPGNNKKVSYHQDATYWNFNNKHRAVTVWLALTDVSKEHGSIHYISGSHKLSQQPHYDVKTSNNLLMRGQTVDFQIPDTEIVTEIPAGNVLIHSPYMIHGSPENTQSTPRIAIGMIFASTQCKPVKAISPESTVMISGADHYSYMLHDPAPTGDWQSDLSNWKLAYDRQHANYYEMSQDDI